MLPVSGALAQVTLDAPGLLPKKPKPGPPPVKAKPPPWPRLDTGAVLCRTPADLARLAAIRAGSAGGGPADCRVITQPTPITIVQRDGPGRTEVRLTGDGSDATGWTDVWLPHNPPSR
ncbi:MAG TPA: hypothetical protein VFN42_12815 [Acetobacteraceae bacterium]|nr:hypothetical protein [Acetobacteraceae bacterium]